MIPILEAGAWGLDIAFFAILLLGILLGVWRGFLQFMMKIAGIIFSVVIAFLSCIPLKNATNGLFGLEAVLCNSFSAVPQIGTWITIAISFVVLVVLVRIGSWLIGKVGKNLIEKSKIFNTIDRTLGGLLGLVFAILLIFFLLAICSWIPSDSLHEFIGESFVVGPIYNWDWFQNLVRFQVEAAPVVALL